MKFILLIALVIATTVNANPQMCRFTLLEETATNQNQKQYAIGKHSKLNHSYSNQTSTTSSMIMVSVGRTASITAYNTDLNVKCTSVSLNSYDAEISKSGGGSSISTSITITKGKRMDLGSIVKDLNDKEKNLDINSGASHQSNDGVSTTRYYLTIQ